MISRLGALTTAYALAVMATGAVSWRFHSAAGLALLALTICLAIPCWRGNQPGLRLAALVAAAAAGLEGVPGAVIIHACFAPVLVAALITITMGIPQGTPEITNGLRNIVMTLPLFAFLQITMGAAYRHKLLSVIPHLTGAPIVAGMILVLSVMLLQRHPEQSTLRQAAMFAIGIVLAQVSLGMTGLVLRLLNMDHSLAFAIVAATHICVAALTLAVSTRLSLCVAAPLGGS